MAWVCPSLRPSIRPYVCPSAHGFHCFASRQVLAACIRRSVRPSHRLSVCPSACPSVRSRVSSLCCWKSLRHKSARPSFRLSVRSRVSSLCCRKSLRRGSVRPSVRPFHFLKVARNTVSSPAYNFPCQCQFTREFTACLSAHAHYNDATHAFSPAWMRQAPKCAF